MKFSFEDVEPDRLEQLFENQNTLALNTGTSLNIDKEKSAIIIDIDTQLIDKEKDEVLVDHTGRTVFQVKGLDEVYSSKNDTYDLPDGLVVQLFSLAYSHARALLATEIGPTMYKDKYLLPVIDPTEFLKKEQD